MDKYEYKIRADEIKELIAQGDYGQAAEIADTIDWRRVKSVMMLCTISDLYKINRRYEDAKNMLLLAYERRPGGRTICYSLCELCIKTEEFVQAVNYYKEFVQVAPKDSGRYILQYKLYEAQDVSLEERIGVLEELKKRDYREKWAYELAYLYHRVGLATRCVEECDELILWFGGGKYVIKALELKMLHAPLTPEQQQKYDNRFGDGGELTGQEPEDLPAEEPQQEYVQEPYADGETVTQDAQPDDVDDIQVKTMDVGQYNTINLQAELAEGLREVLADTDGKKEAVTRAIMEPMYNSDTESLDMPEIEEVDAEDLGPEREEMESSEVFFGETGDLSAVRGARPEKTAEIVMEQMRSENNGQQVQPAEEPQERPEAQLPQEQSEEPHEQPPEKLARVLSQEADGQIRLVVPESERIEKQITGQMSIEDILTEWERMKKENAEKRKEEVRQHVLEQTGTMFTEFEAAVRDGLLEKLEKDNAAAEAQTELEEVAFEAQEDELLEEAAADGGAKPGEIEVTELSEEPEDGLTDEVEELEPEPDSPDDAEETEASADAAQEVTEQGVADAAQEAGEADLADDAAEPEDGLSDDEVEELEPEPEFADEAEDDLADDVQETEEPDFAENAQEAGEPDVTEDTDGAEEPEIAEEQPEDGLPDDGAEEPEPEATEAGEAAEAQEKAADAEAPAQTRKQKTRSLTREERELYAPFIQSRAAREELIRAIDNISLASYTGNIIITGDEGMDTITLAKNMIREVQMTDSNFSGTVAKISGAGLNRKSPAQTLDKLKNGALIIEKAAEMNAETSAALQRVLQREGMGVIIVLEDTRKAMNKFLKANEKLAECFTARVDVEALSNDTLVSFGRKYAREMEYSIDELGVLALHTRIEELQTIDHAVTVIEVKKIVDEAIRHANRKTLGHFFDILFAKRYDDEDMIILTEKDFA